MTSVAKNLKTLTVLLSISIALFGMAAISSLSSFPFSSSSFYSPHFAYAKDQVGNPLV